MLLLLFFVALASLLIALRPIGFDNDYQTYLEYYDKIVAGDPLGVEIGYQLISLFLIVLRSALLEFFIHMLLLHCMQSSSSFSEWIVIVVYMRGCFFHRLFACFFSGLGVDTNSQCGSSSCGCLGNSRKQKTSSVFYFLFAVLLHNVSFLIIALWLVQRFLGSLKYPIVMGVALVVFLGLEYAPIISCMPLTYIKRILTRSL